MIELGPATAVPLAQLDAALGPLGRLQPAPGRGRGHAMLALGPGVSLGAALAALVAGGADRSSPAATSARRSSARSWP